MNFPSPAFTIGGLHGQIQRWWFRVSSMAARKAKSGRTFSIHYWCCILKARVNPGRCREGWTVGFELVGHNLDYFFNLMAIKKIVSRSSNFLAKNSKITHSTPIKFAARIVRPQPIASYHDLQAANDLVDCLTPHSYPNSSRNA
uniref:(northern house mosquito) hypothetical protein n=1 Tax=Culex pipiens TaxID=7175 RepID=A0A8D8EXC1_CULPI